MLREPVKRHRYTRVKSLYYVRWRDSWSVDSQPRSKPLSHQGIVRSHRILGNMCGATSSVGGRKQYETYLNSIMIIVPSSAKVLRNSTKRFRFGAAAVPSLSIAIIRMPCTPVETFASKQPMSFEFPMDIVNLDVPLLMGLDVLLDTGATVDISESAMCTYAWQTYIEVRNEHVFVPPEHAVVLLSTKELTSLRKKLSHSSASKLTGFLQRARPEEMDSATRTTINAISRECDICSRFGPAPLRGRSSIPNEAIHFNEKVCLDIFFVDASPVLLVICSGTRFSATALLGMKSSASVWSIFLII
jgi:hypothetical protein